MEWNKNLIWLDLEMTGLNPDIDVILQAAIIITNSNLEELDEGIVCYIKQPKEVLDAMNDWCKMTHSKNGLVEKCLNSKTSLKKAESLCLDYVATHTKQGESPLCGNSICQDRRFLYRYMPKLANFFHYRNLDVSSFKIIKQIFFPSLSDFVKEEKHEAMADIRDSILELKYYQKKY